MKWRPQKSPACGARAKREGRTPALGHLNRARACSAPLPDREGVVDLEGESAAHGQSDLKWDGRGSQYKRASRVGSSLFLSRLDFAVGRIGWVVHRRRGHGHAISAGRRGRCLHGAVLGHLRMMGFPALLGIQGTRRRHAGGAGGRVWGIHRWRGRLMCGRHGGGRGGWRSLGGGNLRLRPAGGADQGQRQCRQHKTGYGHGDSPQEGRLAPYPGWPFRPDGPSAWCHRRFRLMKGAATKRGRAFTAPAPRKFLSRPPGQSGQSLLPARQERPQWNARSASSCPAT
jgi:hypothetical protein